MVKMCSTLVLQVVERQSKLKRPELLRYASRVMKLDKEGESFMQKLNRLFMEAGAPPSYLFPALCPLSLSRYRQYSRRMQIVLKGKKTASISQSLLSLVIALSRQRQHSGPNQIVY